MAREQAETTWERRVSSEVWQETATILAVKTSFRVSLLFLLYRVILIRFVLCFVSGHILTLLLFSALEYRRLYMENFEETSASKKQSFVFKYSTNFREIRKVWMISRKLYIVENLE